MRSIERRDDEHLLLRRDDTRLEARCHQQLAHHATQSLRLVPDRLEVAAGGRVEAITRAQLGGERADAGQRCLKIVSHATQEIGLDGCQCD